MRGGAGGAYREWAQWWGLAPSKAGSLHDADEDGQPNIGEFAFGLNPLRVDAQSLEFRFDAEAASFLASRPPYSGALPELVFQVSTDLRQWDPFTAEENELERQIDGWCRLGPALDRSTTGNFFRYSLGSGEE